MNLSAIHLVMPIPGSPLEDFLAREAFREGINFPGAGILWHRPMHGDGCHQFNSLTVNTKEVTWRP